jgi:hypothetical protein
VSDTANEAGKLPAAYTPADHNAVNRAAASGGAPVDLNGHKVAPGGNLAASVGRNELPLTLLLVLVLLSGAALATVVTAARRRAVPQRTA